MKQLSGLITSEIDSFIPVFYYGKIKPYLVKGAYSIPDGGIYGAQDSLWQGRERKDQLLL